MPIKFPVLGKGGYFGFLGGGECRFYFYGLEDFLRKCQARLKISIEIDVFQSLGPQGPLTTTLIFRGYFQRPSNPEEPSSLDKEMNLILLN